MLIEPALRNFAAAVKEKMGQPTHGQPEDQLRAPFEIFLSAVAAALRWKVVPTGETTTSDRLGRLDYAIHKNGLLMGHAELKATGTGAAAENFSGRNREQFERFRDAPNLLYSDGNEWALYRNGERVGKLVRLARDLRSAGAKAVGAGDAHAIENLLRDFLTWRPIIPKDLPGLAGQLAPLCRMLRGYATEAVADAASPLAQVKSSWQRWLFPDASDEEFADAYAQTVTFGLLLGRSQGADPLTLSSAESALRGEHSLLSKALTVLTDDQVLKAVNAPVDLLLRVIGAIPKGALSGSGNPWLYFYEHFLASYDAKLRKDAGAYYTPVEVVHCQVRLVDEALRTYLGKPQGFADDRIVTLDPAVGTGTYLLGVAEHALERAKKEMGAGAVPGIASVLAANLYGFENMVGPYAVADLRVSQAIRDSGGVLTDAGSQIYLTDTLESPFAKPPKLDFFLRVIAEQRKKALVVKSATPVIVCIGNPPYDRHAADRDHAHTGGWVRWGDKNVEKPPLLESFLAPVREAKEGGQLKNLYNLYVYFWRWALWKVFEQRPDGRGIVSFISASSYLDGPAFAGMREHMRRECDRIWVLDLGGEGRGPDKEENVFAIRTPVAIAVAVRSGDRNGEDPAEVQYARLPGSRQEKLEALDRIVGFDSVRWRACPKEWAAPFRPSSRGHFSDWPLLTDLRPWQHSGVQFKRTWPIAPKRSTLDRRWRRLLGAPNLSKKRAAFRETGDRSINKRYAPLGGGKPEPPLASLGSSAPRPRAARYAYRSFDRQWVLADARLCSRIRPPLWRCWGDRQIYLTGLLTAPLGPGPGLTACADVPDLHHFSGRGAKDIIPLYKGANGQQPNIAPGLLDFLGGVYGLAVSPEDFAGYVYGILAQPAFTERFAKELKAREVRLPLTRDASLFQSVRDFGAKLIWLHTYAERFAEFGGAGRVAPGKARCTVAVPGSAEGYPEGFAYDEVNMALRVGDGRFEPVDPTIFGFDVSGLRVLPSWLAYRMKKGAGRKSSPLDRIRPNRWTATMTKELLELLWVLEATVAGYHRQAELLALVLAGELIRQDDLPPVPDSAREAPKDRKRRSKGQLALGLGH